ncbi:TOBE domain-containing protein [Methanoculleus bourgensis]|uniref:TOBE domain-containing protein n=1 Tax=Methanoculleus bourgensis TaxID=83986 RepID=UPI003B95D0DB
MGVSAARVRYLSTPRHRDHLPPTPDGRMRTHILSEAAGESCNPAKPSQGYYVRIETVYIGDSMEVSSRNQLKGTIQLIKKGPVNSEVTVALPGGIEIVSVITSYSAEKMNLREGSAVYALIKASEVTIGKD